MKFRAYISLVMVLGVIDFAVPKWGNAAYAVTPQKLCASIEAEARNRNIDPNFFARLLWQESKFNRSAVSPKGARGIAQFMPATAKLYGLSNSFDPIKSIRASSNFLNDLRNEFGNLGLAAAGYNAGPARVHRWLLGKSSLPRETREYVKKITGHPAEDWRDKPSLNPDLRFSSKLSFQNSCKKLASHAQRLKRPVPQDQELKPWGAHLYSASSREECLKQFKLLKKLHHNVIGSISPMIIKSVYRTNTKNVRWNVRLGVESPAAAKKLCTKILLSGGFCKVRKTKKVKQ